VISANKLYSGNFEGFILSESREEIKAWTDLIGLKSIPVSKKEIERLKEYEHLTNEREKENSKRSRFAALNSSLDSKKGGASDRSGTMDESKQNLVTQKSDAMKKEMGS